MEPAFFYLIEERIIPHLRKSTTNFRRPLEVGLKLEVTLRHLSTGERYFTAVPMEGWKNDHLQICPCGLQIHFERISTGIFDVSHTS